MDICTGGSTTNRTHKYGKECVAGDIVHMILDLDGMKLRFKVNDIDYGIAYRKIKKSKYRAAVWLYAKSDSVTIIE